MNTTPIKSGEKIGRNDLCPCGSEKKYKKCHEREHQEQGIKIRKYPPDAFREIEVQNNEENAKNAQILGKIGYHLPHLHTVFKGKRVRALYSDIILRPIAETFHEFIIRSLGVTMGEEWGKKQLDLPLEERHYVSQAYEKYTECLTKNKNEDEKLVTGRYSTIPDGYTEWLMCLAFDIYCLQHTKQLPEFLLNRLRKSGHEFQGARYEIAVASIFARIGFEIEFLDDSDPKYKSIKHPDFIARIPGTSVEIAIEAKSKVRTGVLHTPGTSEDEEHLKGNIRSLLSDALKKEIENRPYLIFIDLNSPATPSISIGEKPWVKDIFQEVSKEVEEGKPAKDTAIFFTNFSFHYQREERASPAEHIFSFSLNAEHPMPEGVWEKLQPALNNYGSVPDLDTILQNEKINTEPWSEG